MFAKYQRENTGMPMCYMFHVIYRIMDEHKDVKANYPIHMNPIVRKIANEELRGCDRVKSTEL